VLLLLQLLPLLALLLALPLLLEAWQVPMWAAQQQQQVPVVQVLPCPLLTPPQHPLPPLW
jgi:hypothetical protein